MVNRWEKDPPSYHAVRQNNASPKLFYGNVCRPPTCRITLTVYACRLVTRRGAVISNYRLDMKRRRWMIAEDDARRLSHFAWIYCTVQFSQGSMIRGECLMCPGMIREKIKVEGCRKVMGVRNTEARRAERGWGSWGGLSLLTSYGSGRRCELPSGIWSGAPATTWFAYLLVLHVVSGK